MILGAGTAICHIGRSVCRIESTLLIHDLSKCQVAVPDPIFAREWGRALEALKKDFGLSNNFHGKLTEFGEYLDETGQSFGNILDYL